MKSGNKHGMNWVTPHKRLAIYIRDGLACTWCGRPVEAGAQLTLDHLKPRKRGGGNHERNFDYRLYRLQRKARFGVMDEIRPDHPRSW